MPPSRCAAGETPCSVSESRHVLTDGRKMRVSVKKILQAVTIISLTAYMTLLLRQYSENSDREASSVVREPHHGAAAASWMGYQERLPRAFVDIQNPSDTNTYRPIETNEVESVKSEVFPERQNNKTDKLLPKAIDLDDLFISVKTTKNFHQTRLDVILRTWFVLAREQTYFFSDGEDRLYQQKTNGHLISTNCSSSHNRKALCCKMSVEFDTFLESNKKWFCHFDDDNYVNIPQLLRMLQHYDPKEEWYLGKPSIRAPLEILNRDNMSEKISFWFATGGAGFCISRALALKMMPLASGGKFISIGEKIRLPDDVTMGYIIEHLLNKKLTVIEQFHSHLEPMKFIKQETFSDQITFSYSRYGKETNTITIDGFDIRIDPTRFLSLHCYLFPNFSFCPR